jgi:hypothetical protein
MNEKPFNKELCDERHKNIDDGQKEQWAAIDGLREDMKKANWHLALIIGGITAVIQVAGILIKVYAR